MQAIIEGMTKRPVGDNSEDSDIVAAETGRRRAEEQREANEQQRIQDERRRHQAEEGRVHSERRRESADAAFWTVVGEVRETARVLATALDRMESVERRRRALHDPQDIDD